MRWRMWYWLQSRSSDRSLQSYWASQRWLSSIHSPLSQRNWPERQAWCPSSRVGAVGTSPQHVILRHWYINIMLLWYYLNIFKSVCVWACVNECMLICVCECVRMRTCVRACMHGCLYVCTCVGLCMSVCMCVCAHACIHVYVCVHFSMACFNDPLMIMTMTMTDRSLENVIETQQR